MLFFNTNRRGFLKQSLSLIALTMGTPWANAQSAARLNVGKANTGVRILADVNPVNSFWELQKSIDGGKTWVALSNDFTVIATGKIRWDVSTTEPSATFRTKLATGLKVGEKAYRIESGQTLFAAMTSLRTATPALSFASEYKSDLKGQFITEINGTQGEWVFQVKGKAGYIEIGSSLYTPQLGDLIEWKLR